MRGYKEYQKIFVPLPPDEENGIITNSIDDAFAFLGKR